MRCLVPLLALASLSLSPGVLAQSATEVPATTGPAAAGSPAPDVKAPDAREKGVIIRRDPPAAAATVPATPRSAERDGIRRTRVARPGPRRRVASRTARRGPRYRADPTAAVIAEIANVIVGGALTVFGEPYRYDYTYGYPVVVRPAPGFDYTYGPPRYRRW